MADTSRKPVVLVMGGHDPTGAAGIQADIESIMVAGCQCVSLITVLTAQNTSEFKQVIPQTAENFRLQCQTLLSDIPIDVCKIGLIGDLGIAEVIVEALAKLNDVPVVVDPILQSGTGWTLAAGQLREFIQRSLLRRATVATPNSTEARLLSGCQDIYQAGEKLLAIGCPQVLITGADEATAEVSNILFMQDAEPVVYHWERLPGMYHGSGCTLAALTAAGIAKGYPVKTAIETAQEHTWKALKHGRRYGRLQLHPDRFHHS
jgi:hydroxymethylpyrimidine/phosphomethylpyrimidine kinase